MTCPSCGHENPDSARFCGECGAGLAVAVACPGCGTENPAGQRFCHGCGRRLAEDGAPATPPYALPAHLAVKAAASGVVEGERKQVTVLFVDVEGSMHLAERVDSEVWRAVMDRFFALVCDAVHRYEGTVNKFTGDGAMALFGAPIAHEDHGRRACYAALDLRDALSAYARDVRREHGLGLSARTGLNSGEVVVGTIGDDLVADYTAIGHTVGLAARMEALAEPGRPYVTKATADLVAPYFELEPVGALNVKGVQEPVETYALLGVGSARTRLDAAMARGLSGFVGRDREMAMLEAAREAAAEGGQVVSVVAEAGLGKSRLCHEFAERCRERGMTVTVGTGVAHGRSVPLLPVLEMLRDYFGIAGDDARTARDRIAGRLLLAEDGFRESLPVLFDFLGVADPDNPPPAQMSPEARQRALFAMIRRLVHAAPGGGPGLVVVEDLHWLDPGSEAFLRNLVDSVPGSRTLLLVNYRPEYRADWVQRSYVHQLPLVPLDGPAITRLVGELIGDDPSIDGLAELIATRTGGNPFFIEEVVQNLVEVGDLVGEPGAYRLAHSVDTLAIPPNVQSLLAARIDRLDDRDKAVLQAAAVIGHEFAEPVLRRVSGLAEHDLGTALERLAGAEFVYERALYPEAEYAFKHPLTQDVAYRSQLAEPRAERHAAVADALEQLHPDRGDELAAVLAGHRERAGDRLGAARWSARAATWAGQSHPADVLRHWRHVRALVAGHAGDDQEAHGLALAGCLWTLQFGWRLGIDRQEIDDIFGDAQRLAGGNAWALGAATAAYGIARGMVGDVAEALASAREAKELAFEAADVGLRLVSGHAYWLGMAGRPREALADIDEGLADAGEDHSLGRQLIGFSPVIWARFFRGMLLSTLGRIDEAQSELDRAEGLALEHDDVETLGWIKSNRPMVAYRAGDPGGQLAAARDGVRLAEQLGSSFSRSAGYMGLAQAHFARGEYADALAAGELAVSVIRETRTGLQYEARCLAFISRAHLELGDSDAALGAAEQGLGIAVRQGTLDQEADCRLALAAVLLVTDAERARGELGRASAIAEAVGYGVRADVEAMLGELEFAHGSPAAGRAHLARAHDDFERQGAWGHAQRLRERLAVLAA